MDPGTLLFAYAAVSMTLILWGLFVILHMRGKLYDNPHRLL